MSKLELQEFRSFFFLPVLLAIGVGVWARFSGLGIAPLIDDEYYLAKSIHFILSSGVPEFPGGGYYTRGLAQQYLTAGLLWLVPMDLEFAVRLIPAMCNVLCILPLYLLAKRMGGPLVAGASVILFALSLWETEFARFARMYAPFQLLFLTYLVFWFKAVVDKHERSLIFCALLACFGILVYAASLLLLLFCLVPAFLEKRFKAGWYFALIGFGVVVFIYWRFGVPYPQPVSPADLAALNNKIPGVSAILPPILIPIIFDSIPATTTLALAALFVLYAIVRLWARNHANLAVPLLFTVSLVAAVINLFTLSLAITLIGLLLATKRSQSLIDLIAEYGALLFAPLLIVLFFYVGYLSFNDDWCGLMTGGMNVKKQPDCLKQGLTILFNFPEIVPRFAAPMFRSVPIALTVIALTTAIGLFLTIINNNEKNPASRFLYIFIIVCILFVSVTGTHQTISRYSFFFYPLFLISSTSSVNLVFQRFQVRKRTREIGMMVFLVAFMVISRDYSYAHLLQINTDQVIYRQNYSHSMANHLLPRRDFESPIDYLNQHRRPNDLVIFAPTPADIYFEQRPHFIYIPHSSNRFWERNVSTVGLDIWTDLPLLYRERDVIDVISEASDDVWLVTFSEEWNGEPLTFFRENYPEFIVYTSKDNTIDVFFIKAKHNTSNL